MGICWEDLLERAFFIVLPEVCNLAILLFWVARCPRKKGLPFIRQFYNLNQNFQFFALCKKTVIHAKDPASQNTKSHKFDADDLTQNLKFFCKNIIEDMLLYSFSWNCYESKKKFLLSSKGAKIKFPPLFSWKLRDQARVMRNSCGTQSLDIRYFLYLKPVGKIF